MYKQYLADIKLKQETEALPVFPPLTGEQKRAKLRLKARQRFFENVSISGLVEWYYAPAILIRWMWTLSLLAATGSVFYHAVLLIYLYASQEFAYDLVLTDERPIPFPKVTACAPSGVNRTWVLEHLSFPPREENMLKNLSEKKREEFLETTVAVIYNNLEYISDMAFGPMSKDYFKHHHVITKTVMDLPIKISNFAREGGMPSCQKTVSNCRINGKLFDCCEKVRWMQDLHGPCFELEVSSNR